MPPPRPTRPLALAVVLAFAAPAAAAQPNAAERQARVEGLFVRALTAHAAGDDTAAAAALDEVLALRPGDPAVYDARAEVALARGETADALFYAERAAALAPGAGPFHLRLAQTRALAGQTAAALDAAETARALSPGDPAVWEALAGLYAQAGRDDAERDALVAWVRLDDTAAARLRLSALHEAAGDDAAALANALAARRLAPSDPAVLRRLAALRPEPAPPRPDAASNAEGEAVAGGAAASDVDALLRTVEADPRRLDAWADALEALAAAGDPRAGTVADDALLLFPAVASVAAPAAEAYLAADRPADARRAAERALTALDAMGDGVPGQDADALRARLRRVLASTAD